MKNKSLIALLLTLMLSTFTGCWDNDSRVENSAEEIGENIEDTAENAKDGMEDAADDVEDAAEDATSAVEDESEEFIAEVD